MSKVELIKQGVKATGKKEKDNWITPKFIFDKVYEFYGKEHWFDPFPSDPKFDTFLYDWPEKVYCNPPFSIYLECARYGVSEFDKLLKNDKKSEQIWIMHHSHETRWFKTLRDKASVLCLLNKRVNFVDPLTDKESENTAIGKAQSIMYLGHRVEEFCKVFSEIGYCLKIEQPGWWNAEL